MKDHRRRDNKRERAGQPSRGQSTKEKLLYELVSQSESPSWGRGVGGASCDNKKRASSFIRRRGNIIINQLEIGSIQSRKKK